MVRIKAYIKLYTTGRKIPFYSGYRPDFNFIPDMKTCGKIDLIGIEYFSPGVQGEVEITFGSRDWLGSDFGVGKSFTFCEGPVMIGEGVVKEILS